MEFTPHVNFFGQTDFRGGRTTFGIKTEDRSRHLYVIGKTGMGKSTLLENLAIQDIKNGEGLCVIDPHGSMAEKLLDYVPEERINDVLYFAPFDLDYPVAFNVMEDVGPDRRHLVVSGLMSAFKKIWVDAWSARMEYILSNTLLALLEYPDSTLLSINKMLADKKYREKVVANVKDPGVRSFWVDEFAKYTDRFAAEATPAIQNKVGQFTSNPLIRNIIGQPKSTFDFRQMMDEKKILIINLSKGRIGEGNANLLGSMIITKLYLSAMSRADVDPTVLAKLPPFFLYVDEFQSFANESFADILSEARKYKLALHIAHQYIEQMPEEVRAAVFGNVGTTIAFRVGPFDAEVLEKVFFPQFTKEDLVNLGRFQMYLSLMIDGVGSKPFSATTLPPIVQLGPSYREEIIKSSRARFAKPRTEVEEMIRKLHQGDEPAALAGSRAESKPTSAPKPPLSTNEHRPAPPKSPSPKPLSQPSPAAKISSPLPPSGSRPALRSSPPSPPPIKKISLSALAPKKPAAVEHHKNDLKAALAAVLKEASPSSPPVPKVPSAPAKPPPTPPAPASAASTKPREVPEEVLKKILEV